MGFWNGRVTFTRYRVGGELPVPFGAEVDREGAAAFGRSQPGRPIRPTA